MDFIRLSLSDIILITGVVTIILVAIRILAIGYKGASNVFFAISLIFLSIYVLSNFYIDFLLDSYYSLFWARMSAVSILLFVCSLFVFSRVFDTKFSRQNKIVTIISTYIIGFLLSIFSFNENVIKSVNVEVFPVSINRGDLYYLVILAIVIITLSTAWSLLRTYQNINKVKKYQIKYILVGIIALLMIFSVTNVALPFLDINDYARIGPSFIVILALMGGYALTSSTLTDINFVVLRVSFVTAVVMLFSLLLGSLYQTLTNVYGSILNPNSVLIILFSGFISMFILGRIQKFEDSVLETLDRSKRLDIFNKINDIFIKTYDINIIRKELEKTLQNGFQSKEVHLIISGIDNDLFKKKILNPVSLDQLTMKMSWGKLNTDEEFEYLKLLEKYNVSLLIPIFLEKEFLGNLIFSDKVISAPYTSNEIEFLKNLSITIAVGLKKFLLYSEVQNFNSTLQEKIDKATAELQAQKAQLQEKYQFERDMVGIMGHELRTPMTVAKGMTELLYTKVKTSENVEKDYLLDKLDKIYRSIVKESELIQTMLSTSHIDNNKVNLQLTDVNILELIDFSISAFQKDADLKGLKLEFIKPDFEVPKLLNDQNRLQEIVNNLVSNAIKYTNEGSVRIMLEKQGEFLLYSVIDTGIGIPKNEIANIGKKFYRIHQHLDDKKEVVRAGGTGLGLYVVKGLLVAMGGELLIESEEGVGSKFTALIPLEVKENEKVNITNASTNENDMFQRLGLKK
jgi:signal transduction histidine kinase